MTSPTSRFYAGKSILVSGATGFIGKVLIEKLLYLCSDSQKIYLLIRGAKGKNAHERMIDMISKRPFNIRLKKDLILEKLVAIECNLGETGLGLSDSNRKILIENVSIVFHVAASVKFEAPLEVNLRHNVVATKELLELACKFEQLQCFIHVSTAYSNCQLRQIDEKVYPMDVPDDPMSIEVTKEMIDNRPNTYTYTKAMAENVASRYASRINVVIVRPSIVMSSLKEPAEGWVDTINGPVGLSVLGALGILQKIKVNSEVVFDLIPVDIVTNALITIAWAATEKRSEFLQGSTPLSLMNNKGSKFGFTSNNNSNDSSDDNNNNNNNFTTDVAAATTTNTSTTTTTTGNNSEGAKSAVAREIRKIEEFKKHFEFGFGTRRTDLASFLKPLAPKSKITAPTLDGTVRVFNLTTGTENPCSFYQYFSIGREEAYRKPSSKALRPLLTIPKQKGMNQIQYWIHKIFSHLLFAYIIDTLLGLFGQKQMVIKAVNRMHHANEMFDYFCSNQWTFVTDNVKRLRELQTKEDKQQFNCDVRAINWNEYAKIGWLGCRRFILQESDDTFDEAKRRYIVICWLYYIVKVILLVTLTSIVRYCLSSPIALSMILMPVYGIIYLL